jgi:peptide-methionine (S)-S-oxide reductase
MKTVVVSLLIILGLCATRERAEAMSDAQAPGSTTPSGAESVTLAGGCFWCLEAIFSELRGVESVESGYSGGTLANPTYEQVCTGSTNHAESVRINFDPKVISLHDLLEIFFTVHDPTSLNRQGADVGTQYRSAIFYLDETQKATAEQVVREVRQAGIWSKPIVTQIVPFQTFYKAEGYHQSYFENNQSQPYCRMVIEPKVVKFREKFKDRLARQPQAG